MQPRLPAGGADVIEAVVEAMIAEGGRVGRRLFRGFPKITLRQRFELLVGGGRRRRRGRRRFGFGRSGRAGAQQHRREHRYDRSRDRFIAGPLENRKRYGQRSATLPAKVRIPQHSRVFHPTTLISNVRSPGRQALSHPDFARYAYGRFAATLAWQMIDVVLGYQVWELTRKEDYLGLIGLAQFLPFVVLLLPGGQIADRFDRRLIIALAYGSSWSRPRHCCCSRSSAATKSSCSSSSPPC